VLVAVKSRFLCQYHTTQLPRNGRQISQAVCLDAETIAAAGATGVMHVSGTAAAATSATTGVDGVGESLSVGTKFIARQRRATIPLSSRRCVSIATR